MKLAFSDTGEWAAQDCDPERRGTVTVSPVIALALLSGGVYQTLVQRGGV